MEGEGGTPIPVLYTCMTKETQKRGFSEAKHNLGELRLGIKLCQFSRNRVVLGFRAFRGHLLNSSIPPMCSSESLVKVVNLDAKIT